LRIQDLDCKLLSGAGLGGLFGAFARRLLPLVKKFVVPHAAAALRSVASDVIESKQPFSQSLKSHGVNALKGVGRDLLRQTGSGRRRTIKCAGKRSVKKTKKAKVVKRKKRIQKKRGGGGGRKKVTSDSLRYIF